MRLLANAWTLFCTKKILHKSSPIQTHLSKINLYNKLKKKNTKKNINKENLIKLNLIQNILFNKYLSAILFPIIYFILINYLIFIFFSSFFFRVFLLFFPIIRSFSYMISGPYSGLENAKRKTNGMEWRF